MEWHGVGQCQCSFVHGFVISGKSPGVEGFPEATHAGPGQPGEVAAFFSSAEIFHNKERGMGLQMDGGQFNRWSQKVKQVLGGDRETYGKMTRPRKIR